MPLGNAKKGKGSASAHDSSLECLEERKDASVQRRASLDSKRSFAGAIGDGTAGDGTARAAAAGDGVAHAGAARNGAAGDGVPGSSAPGSSAAGDSARTLHPACFTNIYESPDGRLAVFEDANGHLVAVDTARLV